MDTVSFLSENIITDRGKIVSISMMRLFELNHRLSQPYWSGDGTSTANWAETLAHRTF
jgi:hypothetical protein